MQINWSIYKNDQKELEKLWEAAHLDALTKLYNRYGMETWITKQLSQKNPEDVAAMLIVDVDNFKYVNDHFGHMLGDALLVDIADMIRDLFHEDFLCGRIGGDEYQIFAMNISKEEVCQKAQSMCQLLKDKYSKEHQNYNISISIGVAFSDQNRGCSYSDLYKMADLALYQAKTGGKNGYFLYGQSIAKEHQAALLQTPSSYSYPDRAVLNDQSLQIGDSGFSSPKILLDSVIDILAQKLDPKTTIERISKLIVDSLDVTRAYASCYLADECHIGKSYYYSQKESQNIPPNIPFSAREYAEKCFNSDHIFFCTDIENTIEPMKSQLKKMGVQTLLQVLIYKDDKIIGTLGINNCDYKRLWLKDEIEVIHTIARLLTDTIYQLQLES